MEHNVGVKVRVIWNTASDDNLDVDLHSASKCNPLAKFSVVGYRKHQCYFNSGAFIFWTFQHLV